MSNHYHLLLATPEGNLSQIMRHINAGYTTWFNKRRHRFGHLFQSRYKAILADADPYAIVKKSLKLEQSLYSILQILSVTLFEKTQLQQALSGIDPMDINDDAYKQLSLLG